MSAFASGERKIQGGEMASVCKKFKSDAVFFFSLFHDTLYKLCGFTVKMRPIRSPAPVL